MNSSILRRTSLPAAVVAVLVAALDAATTSPPTAASLLHGQIQTPVAPALSISDFGACLGGRLAADCFNAGRMYRVGDASQPGVPNAPLSLSYTLVGNIVTLRWNAPVGGDPVHSYIIEAGSASGAANLYNQPTFSTATSLTVQAPNGAYYVRVRAGNVNTGVGPVSNEVLIVVNYGACSGPPTNLNVVAQSAGTITLEWQPPATGSPFYYFIRAGRSRGSSEVTLSTQTPVTTFTVPNVPGGSYYARVHSFSLCGTSAASNEVLVFVVSVAGEVQVQVSWNAASDVDLHVVEPGGEEIYYGNSASATGGQLDVDSNAGCAIDGRQIENIRWTSGAPNGLYVVRVDYWDSCGVALTNYSVTVRNGPQVIGPISGVFTGGGDQGGAGDGVFITQFRRPPSDIAGDAVRNFFRPPPTFTPSPKKMQRQ